MNHLIQPLFVGGARRCCIPALKRTAAVLYNSATETAENKWRVWNAPVDTSPSSGTVIFGICCATKITITLNGVIGTYLTGYDFIKVIHNDAEVFHFAGTHLNSDKYGTISAGPEIVEIGLTQRACGHIIEIWGAAGTKGSESPNTYWDAEILIE